MLLVYKYIADCIIPIIKKKTETSILFLLGKKFQKVKIKVDNPTPNSPFNTPLKNIS